VTFHNGEEGHEGTGSRENRTVVEVWNAVEWIQLIVLGGLLGAAGQGARVIIGLKKVADEAAAKGESSDDRIVASRLVISLAIGFVAGVVAAVLAGVDLSKISLQQVLALAGAGYVGADFIEGAMSRFVPSAEPDSSKQLNVTPPKAPGTTPPTQLTQPAKVDDYAG
jgi:hypothetical protein